MKIFWLTLWLLIAQSFAFAATSPTSFVDPMIGTDGHGHTYPGATMPFGMVQLSPETNNRGWDWCSGYHYSDTFIVGFSHLHLSGTGCADLGDILFLPFSSPADSSRRSSFSHEQEKAEPGFYSVRLLDSDIEVELSATERTGIHRYTYPNDGARLLLIDLGFGNQDSPLACSLQVESSTRVWGMRRSAGWSRDQWVYFVAEFSDPILSFNGARLGESMIALNGQTVRATMGFAQSKAPLLIKVGISAVSVEGARKNLEAEAPNWDFNRYREAALETWERELEKVVAEAMNVADQRTFYTALYHSFLAPTLYCDTDGSYRGGDGKIHQSRDFENYCTFSLWDTYRAAHPLYTIVQPERVPDMVNSMLAFERESGLLPVWNLQGCETWCMIGYHSVPVIADAILKGFSGFDYNQALEAMKKSAYQSERGLQFYNLVEPKPVKEKLAELRLGVFEVPDSLLRSATKHVPIVRGYAKSLNGEVIHYNSSYPYAKDALLVRATDGTMQIEWQTDPVPETLTDTVTFMWLSGLCTFRGGHRFDLYGNGDYWLSFNAGIDTTERFWTRTGENGVALTFLPTYLDVFDDFFGEAFLKVPKKLLTPGEPLTLRVIGENGNSSDWYMTFQHASRDTLTITQEYALADSAGKLYQILGVQIESLNPLPECEIRVELEGRPSLKVSVNSQRAGLTTVDIPVEAVSLATSTRVNIGDYDQTVSLRPISPFGYIPSDKERESVSKTLEYAFDDWCIAQVAEKIGDSKVAGQFHARSAYYKNLFDMQTGFMRGRNSEGSWVSLFDPRFGTEKQPQYTEGNAWQYSWYVPQDVPGLIALHGGNSQFVGKLDSLFEHSSDLEGLGATADVSGLIGLYAHGNEPSHHIAYLYNYADRPEQTQRRVRQIMRDFYTDKADGLCGNEDCGQMSAWYVLSAMGFYPVNPSDQTYQIGTPLLKSAMIKCEGKEFRVNARNLTEENKYVRLVTFNGEPLTNNTLRHQDILSGGVLEFQMEQRPSRNE